LTLQKGEEENETGYYRKTL